MNGRETVDEYQFRCSDDYAKWNGRPLRIEAGGKPYVRSEWREEASRKLGSVIPARTWPDELVRSCLSCLNFSEANEHCREYNARPPARIIAFGCGKYWDEYDIPF